MNVNDNDKNFMIFFFKITFDRDRGDGEKLTKVVDILLNDKNDNGKYRYGKIKKQKSINKVKLKNSIFSRQNKYLKIKSKNEIKHKYKHKIKSKNNISTIPIIKTNVYKYESKNNKKINKSRLHLVISKTFSKTKNSKLKNTKNIKLKIKSNKINNKNI